MRYFAAIIARETMPHGLFFVLWHPPLGKDLPDAQFPHQRSPLRLKFSGYILNGDTRELEGHSLFCMREIVVAMRQISIAHEASGSRACKIGEGNRISSGVGLIDESKHKRVGGSKKRIVTSGPHVPRIFMQSDAGQKTRCALGTNGGNGISIKPSERPGTVLPFARIVFCGIGHAYTGSECRQDNRRRPKSLMSVDCKFIAEGQTLRIRGDRQKQESTIVMLR